MYGNINSMQHAQAALEAMMMMLQGFSSIGSLISLALYLLLAFGLYTIAHRRQLNHAWLAFIPVANLWILGSIADQYQYVAKGAVRNRRLWLVILEGVRVVLSIIFSVALVVGLINLFSNINTLNNFDPFQLIQMLFEQFTFASVIGTLICLVSLASAIFQWICYYDLFSSCNPSNNVLFLVLGIIFSFLMSIFVFVIRNKDEGMPPPRTNTP